MATKKKDKQKSAIDPKTGERAKGKYERELPVTLTEKERAEYGDQLAAAELERDRLVDEKSAYNSKQGQKIKEASERITKLATALDNGTELRLVPCNWEDDYTRKQRWLVRLDTNQEVPDTRRAMTTEEMQIGNGLGDARPPKKDDGIVTEDYQPQT